MKSNNSDLDREIKRLKKIHIYQILMSLSIILMMIFLVLWIITLRDLNAQKKLRGDFNDVKLTIQIKLSPSEDNEAIEERFYPLEETFKLYQGPNISKEFYGKSLGYYLREKASPHFIIKGGLVINIKLPPGQPIFEEGNWEIYSYSNSDVDKNHKTRRIDLILLDRVNIFIFQISDDVILY